VKMKSSSGPPPSGRGYGNGKKGRWLSGCVRRCGMIAAGGAMGAVVCERRQARSGGRRVLQRRGAQAGAAHAAAASGGGRRTFVPLKDRMRQSIENGTNMMDWKEITPQWKVEKLYATHLSVSARMRTSRRRWKRGCEGATLCLSHAISWEAH